MRNQVFKKLFSVLLALIMVAGLLPASVLAEGEGNADSTPAPTEAVQPTESAEPTKPAETETPEVTEVPEPTPENPAATVEPTQGEPTAEPTDDGIMPANVMPVQANVAARDISKDGFIRIFHLDCGRKYFSVSEINGIIDQLAENNYTHIQLAFGNDGLRFLLNDMSVTVNGKTYDSDSVKTAIKKGNSQLTNGSSGELSQSEMESIISHANDKGIKVIPLFNAPGHMYAVVNAMNSLGVNGKYIQVSNPYDARTPNWAVDPTDANAVAFAEALLGKYVAYFASKGSTMFNIGADESGINNGNYAAYATMVNAMNSIVKSEGMTTLAYNDGIYNTSFASSYPNVTFDNDIVICYWTSGANSESVANLLNKGFKILNNSDNWYYVLGDYLYTAWGNNGQWGYEDALNGIKNTPVTNMKDYNGSEKPIGSILCVWCDAPNQTYEPEKVYDLIKTMANANPDYFKKEAANVPAVEISENETNVKTTKETVDGKTVYKAAVKADGTSKIQLKVVNIDNTVNWASDNSDIATVDENGLVTFKGAEGAVTITATPFAATRSINETAAYSITFNVTKEGEVPQIDKDITVVEGGMAKDVIEGYNYSSADQTVNPEESIATVVSIVGQQGQPGTVEYKENSVSYSALAGNNTSWTKTEYFHKVNDNYYPVYAYRYYYYYYHYGYSVTDSAENVEEIGSSRKGSSTVTVYKKTGTEAVPASTTVAFKGVAEGDTTVTIGHVTYNVHVTKEDVTSAPALPVQLWITNNGIQVDSKTQKTSGSFGNNRYAFYASIKAEDAYYEEGKPLSELIPASISGLKEWGNVYWDKTAQENDTVSIVNNDSYYMGNDTNGNFAARAEWTLDLYKGMLHTSGNFQTNYVDSVNRTESGTEFHYVRYFDKKWEVSADRIAWVGLNDWSITTGTCTSYNYSSSSMQIVAYYMARTDVTEEVTTDVVDWGNAKPTSSSQVILDYAVKYPDGTRRPKSEAFPINEKTMYFNMLSSSDTVRLIYEIKALETGNREVYMITVTPSSNTSSEKISISSGNHPTYSYKGTEMVAWVDDEANLPPEFMDTSRQYTSINGKIKYTVGGEPTIKGVEIYENQAMLVTYYLRDKVTKDTLYVHYIDKTADKEFYQYTITVKENTFFDDKINKKADPNWKDYLDYGTVKNDLGVDITVSADLGTMPKIGAEYRYADYYCESVKWEEPGKHVYLYYTFKYNVTFVVDFGLPLVITPDKVNASLGAANITSTIIKQASYYADIKVVDIKNVVYKLNSTIDGEDNFTVTYKGANLQVEGQPEGSVTYTIRIIPATSVYYEDSFAKFTDGSGAAEGATWAPVYDTNITAENNPYANTAQALEALGNKTYVYGYDPKYDNCTMFSLGSARKVTVTYDMATTGVVWPTAQFTFKGTGFDIISLTDNTSGAIFVDVVNKETGKKEKSVFVDNYYGYTYDATNGWQPSTSTEPNALYQIPVIAVRGLGYAEYNVVIKVAYSEFFDHTTPKGSYSFWLDAVRVYDPMGESVNTGETYKPDGEAYPQYIKLRSELKKLNSGETASSGALFIDGKENANISEYANYGPNNEVYLAMGQAITFKLNVGNAQIETVQIGAKAPNGTAKLVVNNGEAKVLGTATEMYYDITTAAVNNGTAKLVTITNTGEAILSLTNLKITYKDGNQKVSLGEVSAEQKTQAVQMVRALFAPAPVEPEPEKTFEPDRFEASWSRNVMQGRKATLTVKTSEDVEAITVDGQTIRSYRTRTERVGFGRRAKRITYREFTYSMVAQESADFSVTAINAEGTESEAITARLTVKTRPNSLRDMWDWFKGWF